MILKNQSGQLPNSLSGTQLILQRLMWPLAATFVLLTLLVAVVLWHQENRFRQENLGRTIINISDRFQHTQTEQIAIMSALLEYVSSNSALRDALRNRDRERLLSLSHEHFETMRREQGITHYYFQDSERNNIVRVQFPEKIGGYIDRFTIREAERTGKTFGGLELGTYGILTLRVVKPVFSDGTLIGYIELGRELEDLLHSLHPDDHSVEIAITLHKENLQREAWQTGRGLTNTESDWDRFQNDVISYSTLNPLPNELLQGHLHNYTTDIHGKSDLPAIASNDHIWRVGFIPLIDASGRDIGDVAIMLDITADTTAFYRTLFRSGIAVTIILSLLMLFLYKLLKKTDRQLVNQQKQITKIETQHQAIINVARDGIILIDDKGIIQLSNPAIEAIFGYSAEELLGKKINILMPEPDRSNHDKYMHEYIQTGKAKIIGTGRSVKGRRKDGSVFPLDLAVTEARIEHRRQFVGVLRDITERKQAEEELIEAKEEAEQASRAKTAFLSSMSHELRTPLNAVLGFGQLLEMSTDLDTAKQDWVREIMKAGNHLLRLVNDVLDLARIESEQLKISIQDVSLYPVVENCFSLLGPLSEKHGIQLTNALTGELIVRADPDRLKQVLINLVSNAIKYNRKDGTVSIETETIGKHLVRISVIDTGRGIPAEKFDALFQPFNRLGEEGGTIEGTGIGLTITLRMVELMDGMMGVESTVGVGSRFWIDLPAVTQH